MPFSLYNRSLMKTKAKLFLSALLLTGASTVECAAQDWPDLNRYRDDNRSLMEARRNDPAEAQKTWVVFMGNSITQNWAEMDPDFFSSHNYIGRGISGQTSPQMLLRFRQDVIGLAPKAVVILAGTNDIAGNTGPSSIEMIMDNIVSMTQLARANGIEVVLCSVLPANRYRWAPEVKPAETIVELNRQIKAYAKENQLTYVDFYTPLVDDQMGLNPAYGNDGVHPTLDGYKIMEPLVVKAIEQTLTR